MVPRPFWVERIEAAWKEASVVWLAGVRRSGKTVLARALGDDRILYLNCDLPATEDRLSNPELFYRDCDRPIVVFDEVHRLKDPSRVLKIGADEFPKLRILATGSSTLAASRKFSDTLTGRKRLLHLTPVLWDELAAFGNASLLKRLHHGGLPEALLADQKNPSFYREWMDSFFARDIQRLFAFRDPDKFNTLFEYLLKQSGGLLEVARTARALGVGRPTVESHLRALSITQAVTVLRPFHGGGRKELVKTPKVYGFDTGFVAFCRGWDPLRTDDYGPLWEHVVLEYMQAHGPYLPIHHWRDVAGREVDFVLPRGRNAVDAVECKWDPARLDSSGLKAFRSLYPRGTNYLVCPSSVPPYRKTVGGLEVVVAGPDGWWRDASEESRL